jgi:hypothetical protein
VFFELYTCSITIAAFEVFLITDVIPLSLTLSVSYISLLPISFLLTASNVKKALPFFATEAIPFLQPDLTVYPSLDKITSPHYLLLG